MDFLGALSGLERIAIIAGAMLVGYWGYRLLATDRTPALIFMGISCAVLFGALFTGGSHVKNVGESYQLATAGNVDTISATDPHEISEDTEVPEVPDVPEVELAQAPAAPGTEPPNTGPADDAQTELTPNEPAAQVVVVTRGELETSPPAEQTPDVLSNLELGGRIVSVKSGNLTLEWSPREG